MVSEDGSEATAFDGYVEALIEVIGHADRAEPLRDYCTGLMMPVARKLGPRLLTAPVSAKDSPANMALTCKHRLNGTHQAAGLGLSAHRASSS